ncbi:PHP-associated domain-containing protein [Halobaculum gomorrense]|uniref:Predicted metal-dependent phosphoesterase TrpH, contains PHP domain n=1 Tax=Halobaculum gomorrense TaxID=43928 RepID=A0A1M5QQF2_9EURY|nr:PHP-associated domain-containing protein [Halobaculum gomorrense]SHH15813.1 Predicted metal-dependent phosphoesterase TrpH, contains PHP domain [Halobaculum gomorrense]
MSGGPTRVDPHVKVLDERVVERARESGIDTLVYAPHFTRLPEIRERAERFSTDEVTVVPAREVFTGDWGNRRHLLAVGLDDPVPDFITFEAALAEFERQDAAVIVPHPAFMNVSLTRAEVGAYRDRVDAVETYNAKLFDHQNDRGRRIAEAFDIPGFGSSYAHLRGTVGAAWTEFEDDVRGEEALVVALQGGAARSVVKRTDPATRLRRLVEFTHLGYENSWGKLDRLLLSGMEATHPRHIAYDGRFDDVTVY